MTLADRLRTVAAYHGSTSLATHVQHLEDVVRVQREALLEAAAALEKIERRNAVAARGEHAGASLEKDGRVAG